MSLDVLFRSLGPKIQDASNTPGLFPSLAAADPSEAQILPAKIFLDMLYGEPKSMDRASRANSRAPTPMTVVNTEFSSANTSTSFAGLYPNLPTLLCGDFFGKLSPSKIASNSRSNVTRSLTKVNFGVKNGEALNIPKRSLPVKPSHMPQSPDVSDIMVAIDEDAEYAVLVSMYEVYNDRIFDLLTPQGSTSSNSKAAQAQKDKRRPLLFKSTEQSPDRKVVAGLRKIICSNVEEALMVLETGLMERRVTGTGSNAVSSRSHGFFCLEVKKSNKTHVTGWSSKTLTIVDLAGTSL
jgi:Kinesin motor domain